MQFIDTHCHLDAAEFDDDRASVALASQQAGVSLVVVPTVAQSNFARVVSLCESFTFCVPAFGIHPMYVGQSQPAHLSELEQRLSHPATVAVGEIGLDFFEQPHDAEMQEFYFCEQLKLAQAFDLPVILHVRRAVDAVLKCLRRFRVRGGIAHAFNGSRQQADQFIALGFKLGFGGSMTFDRALNIRELARTLPLEAIVLETDAPDIAPAWIKGQRNSPAELPRIAASLAQLRGLDIPMIAMTTLKNAQSVIPKLSLDTSL